MQGYILCRATSREVVLAAVAQNGEALLYASDELKADREVVLAAVAQHGHALRHASAELKADRGVVLAAVAQSGYALGHASDGLKADRGLVTWCWRRWRCTAAPCIKFTRRTS